MATGFSRRRFMAAAPFVAGAALASPAVLAAAYPDRTIKLIAPFAPGGIVDIVARALAPTLSATINQSVVVVNKAGAAGIIGDEYVAHAAPDGYTLLVTGSGALIMGAAIYQNLPFDVAKDFAPVSQLVTGTNVIVVRGNSPIDSIHDLVAYCKAHPDKATYASVASVDWLFSSLLARKTGLTLTRVPYKSTAQGNLAVASGQVLFAVPPATVVMHEAIGVKVLATIAPQRDPGFPKAPTLAEAGVPGVSTNTWIGLFAPARTPPAVVAKLNSSVNRALIQPKAKKLFARVDLTPAGSTTESFRQEVAEGLDFWTKVAKEEKISIKL